jgi:hypothetical protein
MKIDIVQVLPPSLTFKGPNKRGYIILDVCPFCSGRKKFYINADPQSDIHGLSKCFKCSYVKNIRQFMADIGSPILTEKQKINIEADLFALKRPKEAVVHVKDYIPSLNLVNLSKNTANGILYMKSRGLTDEDLLSTGVVVYDENPEEALKELVSKDQWQVIKSVRGQKFEDLKKSLNQKYESSMAEIIYTHIILRGRIVFPVTLNKRLVGYVARDYTGAGIPKVLNSGGELTTRTLWNIDNIKTDTVYLHEGIFNAITCGLDSSVAMLGKNLSDEAINMLLQKKVRNIYITLDIDARKEAFAIKKKIANLFDSVSILSVPEEVKNKDQLGSLISSGVVKSNQFTYKSHCDLKELHKNNPEILAELKNIEWKDINDFKTKDVLIFID